MTSDDEKILRAHAQWLVWTLDGGDAFPHRFVGFREAARAIEAMLGENERLKHDITFIEFWKGEAARARSDSIQFQEQAEKAEAENARLKAELAETISLHVHAAALDKMRLTDQERDRAVDRAEKAEADLAKMREERDRNEIRWRAAVNVQCEAKEQAQRRIEELEGALLKIRNRASNASDGSALEAQDGLYRIVGLVDALIARANGEKANG